MKAFIFAAGMGSRLRPLTDAVPKALVPVAGRPMLEHVILRLKAAGFTDLVINIHHFGQQIIDFLNARQQFGLNIRLSDERNQLLDTGGGIKKARPLLEEGNEPFLVHNVDVVTDVDLRAFYLHHIKHPADATLLVNQRVTSRYLLMDADNRLCGWTNCFTGQILPPTLSYPSADYHTAAFGGIHVLSPSLFRYMDNDERWQGAFSIIPFYVAVCREACMLGYAAPADYWFDIGKPDTLGRAEAMLRSLPDETTRLS
ncbi:MAG: nucleotidyltransferase family protein [Prevotellaceae bacterium]|jgi:NDP-sugar pyrophosphorylase family protein|nr:nucleotidyltransferase family protein [Prevotellaceae bacterium]